MQNLISHLRSKRLYSQPNHSFFLCFFSSSESAPNLSPSISTRTSNPSLSNFLIDSLTFSRRLAISISSRFPSRKSLQNPHSVVQFLKQLGFSDAHIRSSIRVTPNILFSDIDKTLKPKLQFFQDLGFTGPHLGIFISKNSRLLQYSLEKTLIPFVDVIKKTLSDDSNNQDLMRVCHRSYWVASNPLSRLETNIALLESCGIVGSQLSRLLKRRPWLFFRAEKALRDLISQVLDMGFSANSGLFVHAVYTVSGMNAKTFSRKINVLKSFGFSDDECMDMVRRAPNLLCHSEDRMKFGIDFFLNDFKLDRRELFSWPNCLTYSIKKRVIPRYRVIRLITSKGLLQKDHSFIAVLCLTEEKFMEKFISRFPDDAVEILEIYKGDLFVG